MELLAIILSLLLVLILYRHVILRKQMRELSNYIDEAMEGTLAMPDYDERELSKIQSKLMKFLYANQVRESKLNREKNKTKDLIADISHQTKTPITNLLLYISLLEKDPDKGEYIEIIKYELDKLKFLIETLVKSSRLESDIIVIQKTRICLPDIVQEVVHELRESAVGKNINISYKFERVYLDLDERWIKEAIHNLLDNAIKYAPQDTTINMAVYKSYLNYNFDIDNECQSLVENDLPDIFKRFYRGRNSISKDGLGLGLYIAREIIEKHDGKIKASLDDKRIKFSVDFPL
ncbi:MAG: ATP-binding protein [Firmicutes bacterium]|nr:ATP-binding protein [Bacillota bacterium]